MLPKELVDFIQNTAQILLCLFLLAYMIFFAALSLTLLIRSVLRGVEALRSFFTHEISDERESANDLVKEKTYAMAG